MALSGSGQSGDAMAVDGEAALPSDPGSLQSLQAQTQGDIEGYGIALYAPDPFGNGTPKFFEYFRIK